MISASSYRICEFKQTNWFSLLRDSTQNFFNLSGVMRVYFTHYGWNWHILKLAVINASYWSSSSIMIILLSYILQDLLANHYFNKWITLVNVPSKDRAIPHYYCQRIFKCEIIIKISVNIKKISSSYNAKMNIAFFPFSIS